ncbi:kinetochore-associated Ndc80 complex subunit spc24 [Mortierella alpina]|nr:kinetochore-associated Ndc80 complex subunit spc24 [Mortierella alpina]
MEENIATLIQDVTSQFHRSNADVQSIQKTVNDIHETERTRREIQQDARSYLQRMLNSPSITGPMQLSVGTHELTRHFARPPGMNIELARKLQLSRTKGSREHVDPDSLRHDDRMVEMDQQKFALAKSIQDMDQDIASLEAELRQLREQNLELDVNYSSAQTGSKTNGLTTNGRGRTSISAESGGDAGTRSGSRAAAVVDHDEEDDDDDEADKAHATAVLRLQLYRGLGIEMLENDFGEYTRARIRSSSRKDVHIATLGGDLSAFYQTNLIWDFAS